MKLSTEDRLELADLYARYSWAFDEGRAGEWAALFAPDGAFVMPGRAKLTGHDELRAFAARMHGQNAGIRHLVSGLTIEPGGEGARGRAYVVVLVPAEGSGFRALTQGSYDDRFVSRPEGWRFQTRTFTPW